MIFDHLVETVALRPFTAAFNEISRVTGLFPRELLPFISARPALA
jgi:hypothetical protein